MTVESTDFDDGTFDINELLNSDDPALQELGRELQEDMAAPESVETPDATQSVETDPSEPNTEQAAQQDHEEPVPSGIQSKNGQHIIPYSALEAERERNAKLQEQLNQQQRDQAEFDRMKRQLELAGKQGLELPTLPEDEQITDEVIAEMEDISPELGMFGRKLKALSDQLEARQAQMDNNPQSSAQPDQYNPEMTAARTAVEGNPAIKEILADAGMKATAIQIEKALIDQGGFDDLATRYAEVAKRVGGAFGVDFAAKYGAHVIGANTPGQKAPGQAPAMPQSISDMPTSADRYSKSTYEVLAEQNEDRLQDELQNLSDDALASILYGG